MPRYLADTSIWAWARKQQRSDIREKLSARYEQGEIVTCVPVVLEVMHRAETSAQFQLQFDDLFMPLERLPLENASVERALAVQRELAQASGGNHRRSPTDFMIAAAAEAAGDEIALWCCDRDLEVICKHTGQPYEAEKSTGPGR